MADYLQGYARTFDLPVLNARGRPVHHCGLTACPGLYLLGLRWQHTTGSALLGRVKRDAAYIAKQIMQVAQERR